VSRRSTRWWRTLVWIGTLGLVCPGLPALAQQDGTRVAESLTDSRAIVRGERLSSWLLRQPYSRRNYLPGLIWQVPAQEAIQARLKYYLVAQLAVAANIPSDKTARTALADWIRSLPVTGRVPVAVPDARWLQAHPDQDPVLDFEHRVVLPRRPTTVSIITESGKLCQVPHRAGMEALAYLRQCRPVDADRIDKVWVAQPDGHVRGFRIATWNREAQDEPAPGAWIWAPARDAGWPERLSARLAEFLATQGLATDIEYTNKVAKGLTALAPDTSLPSRDEARTRDPMVSANDWGFIGLLQTPTARMTETSNLRFHFSQVSPYGRGSVIFQPLDWLEAGFRYTNISNRLYGPDIAGDQAAKDKSLDVKLRLAQESATFPELALGVIDIGGTGLFSSEYLVANKRIASTDWSLGIAWGYLGGRGNLHNPFSLLGAGFDTRAGSTNASGGTVNSKSFFRGPASLFGGVQYQTPWDNLLLKLEYDGNNYRHEPLTNNQKQDSPLNVGLVYRYSPAIDLTAAIERGNTVMVGITLHGLLDKVTMPKYLDPLPPRVSPTRPTGDPDWKNAVAEIKALTQWTVREIRQRGGDLQVTIEDPEGAYLTDRVDRVIAVLHRDAPASVDRFMLALVERGLPIAERVVWRDEWVTKKTRYRAMADHFESVVATEPRLRQPGSPLWAKSREPFTLGLQPAFSQTLGGPDGFVLYQIGVAAPGEIRIRDDTWISGNANLRMLDNYQNYKYTAPSLLPRVRTYLREYQTTSLFTLPNLQATHVGKLGDSQYYSAYAGYLESMFAGVGGEWLYRPWHSRYAFGVDVNRVQQRDFRQDFTLRDYRVTTGHATLYLDTGWKSTQVTLSAGQYLAGDRGVTVGVSRIFDNGIAIGAYATKTNVSAEKFGEGSFDKGIYVAIPFDAMLPYSSPTTGFFKWNPLTRDGGARLGRAVPLYDLTGARDRRSEMIRPAGRAPWQRDNDDDADTSSERSLFGDLAHSASRLGEQVATGQTKSVLLLGGGAILASSLLDRPFDRWASRHQGGKWDTLGRAANGIPYLLGAGAGLIWMGLGDDVASETAWSAIKATGLTLGVEVLAKYMIGRARPDQNLGTGDFSSGFSTKAANSSFPSGHMGVAFAAVTPFAQQYDAPWLYAVAGMTAFGRIQQRQHFVSDTVAGALIGYGVGSLLLDQQRSRRGLPRIAFGANRIQASWDFQ